MDWKKSELKEKLSTDRRYVVIKRQVPEALAVTIENRFQIENGLREKNHRPLLRGISFERDATRIYPNGKMLCHVVGFMNSEHEGVQGIEMTMDKYLRGYDGFRYIEIARTGKEIVPYRGQERAPRDGCTIRLTIDLRLQNIVETELAAAVEQFKPEKAIAILMRPKTGEILALANCPNFDLNQVRRRQETGGNEERRDHRHDGARINVQNRHRRRRAERETCPARQRHLLRKRRLQLWQPPASRPSPLRRSHR